MRPSLAQFRTRPLAALLAIAILAGSFSVMTGVYITAGPDHPEVRLDVCHPLQAPSLSDYVHVAIPASGPSEPFVLDRGSIFDGTFTAPREIHFTPDPPPPKTLARV